MALTFRFLALFCISTMTYANEIQPSSLTSTLGIAHVSTDLDSAKLKTTAISVGLNYAFYQIDNLKITPEINALLPLNNRLIENENMSYAGLPPIINYELDATVNFAIKLTYDFKSPTYVYFKPSFNRFYMTNNSQSRNQTADVNQLTGEVIYAVIDNYGDNDQTFINSQHWHIQTSAGFGIQFNPHKSAELAYTISKFSKTIQINFAYGF